MRVREHDCTGTDTFQFSQPIQTAINHHICTAKRNQQRRMHAMSLRARADLAARADKRQFHSKKVRITLPKALSFERSAATKCEAWRQAFKHLWSIAKRSEDCRARDNKDGQLPRIEYKPPRFRHSTVSPYLRQAE